MSLPPTIKRLKIRASQTKQFPFDVVYVVPQVLRDTIPRMFPYSLCVPFRTELIALMSNIRVDTHTRVGLHNVATVDETQKGVRLRTLIPATELLESFCVVPILNVVRRESRALQVLNQHPAYLTTQAFRMQPHAHPANATPFRAVFTEDAELFTPDGVFNPICKICPRSLHHLRGECSLGENICHQSLVIRPDRKAATHEQLQPDGISGDSSIGADEPVTSDP